MKKLLLTLLMANAFAVCSQTLTPAIAQGVYGGTVIDVVNWSFNPDSIYIAVSTESTNSIFISKAKRGGSRNNHNWMALPSADADNNFGSSVINIEAHAASNTLFFQSQDKIYSSSLTASNATLVTSLVKTFRIIGDSMFVIKNGSTPSSNDTLVFGTISSGIFSATNGIGLGTVLSPASRLELNPSNKHLYLFNGGSTTSLLEINDAYGSMTNTSSIVNYTPAAPNVPNIEWQTFGFAPDGTWYVAGQPPANNPTITDRWIAWSTNQGASWDNAQMDLPGPMGGRVGTNFIIDDYTSERVIFIGNALQKDTSTMSTWSNVGSLYIQDLNRVNDAVTVTDVIDSDIKYHTTNIGFGYSVSKGDSILSWNEGLEAVQVNDIDMSTNFATGWIASKSGVRKVNDFTTNSPTWYSPIFPQGDGAPYEAVGMDPADSLIVFLGNQRIYRTINGGIPSGASDGWTRVFSPENAPYNFNSINSVCKSIKVSKDSSSLVVAGFYQKFSDKGGVFYSLDGGTNWSQLLLHASTSGQDVDVNDIALVKENDSIVAYIGVEADIPSGVYGLYRAALTSGGTWNVSQDGSYGATVSILDISVSKNADSLIILKKDTGLLPVHKVDIKDLSTSLYTSYSGPNDNGNASAITIGDNLIFFALNEKIYVNPISSPNNWSLGYTYPVGTQINVLFYDELLVGTGTGLYAHELDMTSAGLNAVNLESERIIFPNPTDGSFRVKNLMANDNLSIYSLSGVLLQSLTAETIDQVFHIDNLSSGIYLIKLTNSQGTQTSRIQLNR